MQQEHIQGYVQGYVQTRTINKYPDGVYIGERKICKNHWEHGFCNFGDRCHFLHQQDCIYFPDCQHDNCIFRHVETYVETYLQTIPTIAELFDMITENYRGIILLRHIDSYEPKTIYRIDDYGCYDILLKDLSSSDETLISLHYTKDSTLSKAIFSRYEMIYDPIMARYTLGGTVILSGMPFIYFCAY